MDLFELKWLISEVNVTFGSYVEVDTSGAKFLNYCLFNGLETNDFIMLIKRKSEQMVSEIIKNNSSTLNTWILNEYLNLKEKIKPYELNGNKYFIYTDFKVIWEPYNEMFGDLSQRHFPKEKQNDLDAYLNIINSGPANKELVQEAFSKLLDPVEVREIFDENIASQIDFVTRHIIETINYIKLNLQNLSNNKEDASKANKDRLSVKQQMLILHYLFQHIKNSETEIPISKLASLVGYLLNRNSETIRSLLTYITTVEPNENDDKIAKTPKNLFAVADIFNILNIRPLEDLINIDLHKLKKS